MTTLLFRDDAYLRSTSAKVIDVLPDGAILLDQTVFYATSGGQPGDSGALIAGDGNRIVIATAIHPDGDKTRIVHVPAEGQPTLSVGDAVTAEIDWDRRYRLMRMHTALHLLSVAIPLPVTSGSIGEDKGRLDFDMPESPEDVAAIEAAVNAMVDADYPVTSEWISDDEMLARPDLIKTMKVKPPMGQGRVRLVRIGDIDLQPCGGTHVARTSEIGRLTIGKIEKKGKQNRRINLHFA
ncbi:Ala-tRNA(Pro) hydrolase [Devosia sp. Leaf420]|uniref:alanyl-tRNA editing protein n=1 Tax=Devosia sp. Leaf420 TaxID=1736374 RepID=UPI000712E0D8|nr:alanyl-tRNA editing protein [Devosia sp. Leaf420]KQT51527.1 Ala-tRNA(Pro) hydrolase [Devosia sp. Leaf420]